MSDEQINDKLDRILEAMDGQHIVELKQIQVNQGITIISTILIIVPIILCNIFCSRRKALK